MNELKNTSQPQQKPTSTFSMEIDGRIYTVRTFFKDACAETLQQKIERMIRRDLLAYRSKRRRRLRPVGYNPE